MDQKLISYNSIPISPKTHQPKYVSLDQLPNRVHLQHPFLQKNPSHDKQPSIQKSNEINQLRIYERKEVSPPTMMNSPLNPPNQTHIELGSLKTSSKIQTPRNIRNINQGETFIPKTNEKSIKKILSFTPKEENQEINNNIIMKSNKFNGIVNQKQSIRVSNQHNGVKREQEDNFFPFMNVQKAQTEILGQSNSMLQRKIQQLELRNAELLLQNDKQNKKIEQLTEELQKHKKKDQNTNSMEMKVKQKEIQIKKLQNQLGLMKLRQRQVGADIIKLNEKI